MDKFISIHFLAWLLILSACQNSPERVVTPAEIIPTEPAAEEKLPTPTLVPIASSPIPLTPTLSPTIEPSITPTDLPSPTPTQTPIPENPVESISLKPILEGVFERPVYLTHAFDERLFIVEQAGLVRILKDGVLVDQPFLDIRDRVASGQLEQGLLSIAFHPNYPEDNRVFANYTDIQGNSHISSFIVEANNPDAAVAESEIILLNIDQPFPNHNGGQLQFGPDGYLYAGFGDGGSYADPFQRGQDPSNLFGTLLRLDVDFSKEFYSIPPTNPFINDPERRNEIWAWGLRNPWRFSFDRLTGDLFIADVGESMWEEVDFQANGSSGGENYGWNILEGSHCFKLEGCEISGLELPIFEYDHQGHCSITGGYMYRGKEFLSLYGNYFAADFCSGTIWALFPENDGSWIATEVLDTEYQLSSFGEDVNGELYLLAHTQGSIYQLQP